MQALLACALLAAVGQVPAKFDSAAFRRGAEAVDTKTSASMAVRAEPGAPASFRLGAAYRAWRNATAAAEHDATHTTGDGGDAALLAADCTDERVAFLAIETERAALGLTAEDIGRTGAIDARLLTARGTAPPKECR